MEQKMNNPMIETNKKEQVHYEYVGYFFSPSSTSSNSQVSSSSSSNESNSFEEVTSPTSFSSSHDPLSDMSSLFEQLPLKRGLSKFYQGRSQSFTSLAKVMSLEDLVKPENPRNKKLKSCKSYGEGLGGSQECSSMSRLVSKKGMHSANSRGSCSSLSARKGSANFMSSRPPVPSHRSSSSTTHIYNPVLFT